MSPRNARKPLLTGADLRAWRDVNAISAKELAKLIGVTERTVHRAEKSGKIGGKLKLALELLQSRLDLGEINLPAAPKADPEPTALPGEPTESVREEPSIYGSQWHGELRTGMDIRQWRNSIGLYQKELAKLLEVDVATLVRAEQSQTPSSRLIYGAELLRRKIQDGELALFLLKKDRLRRGRPKKQ
jgi:DNA-binding XRE family transcriptional regulator